MRREHDEANDILRMIQSDAPVAKSEEHEMHGARHVLHYDANGMPVRIDIHGYSREQEYWRQRQALTTRRDILPAAGRSEVIGHVGWVISETATSKIVSQGDKEILLQDVRIQYIESPDDVQVSKRIPLDPSHLLGISGGNGGSAKIVGFGLVCDRTDLHTFCWEWFNVDGPNHATKLQESGQLKIRIGNPGGLWQVIRTELLTDISLRVSRFGEPSTRDEPTWRALIRKGSWIDWPSVVGGVITLS